MICKRCGRRDIDHDEVWTRERGPHETRTRDVLHLICPRAFDAFLAQHEFEEQEDA